MIESRVGPAEHPWNPFGLLCLCSLESQQVIDDLSWVYPQVVVEMLADRLGQLTVLALQIKVSLVFYPAGLAQSIRIE